VEILAFLVLGLIAMLAIVPPLVRGRIEESPLDTTRHFRRSMLEMAASVNPSEYGRAPAPPKRRLNLPLLFSGTGPAPGQTPRGGYSGRVVSFRRASERRMRVYAVLGSLVVATGIAAIIARTAVVTAIFFFCVGLLLLYFFLVQLMVKRR